MRITVDKNDTAFDPKLLQYAYSCDVFVDDVLTHDCITADTDAGEAVVYARDASGNLCVDMERGTIMCKTVKGVVRIVERNHE